MALEFAWIINATQLPYELEHSYFIDHPIRALDVSQNCYASTVKINWLSNKFMNISVKYRAISIKFFLILKTNSEYYNQSLENMYLFQRYRDFNGNFYMKFLSMYGCTLSSLHYFECDSLPNDEIGSKI